MGLDAAMNVLTSVVALAWRLEKMVSILSGGGMRRKGGRAEAKSRIETTWANRQNRRRRGGRG